MKYYFNFRENGQTSKLFRTRHECIEDQAKFECIQPELYNLQFTIDTTKNEIEVVCMYI